MCVLIPRLISPLRLLLVSRKLTAIHGDYRGGKNPVFAKGLIVTVAVRRNDSVDDFEILQFS